MRFDLKAGLQDLAIAVTAKPASSSSAPAESKSEPAGKPWPKKKGDDVLHCASCGAAGPWTIADMTVKLHKVPAAKLGKTAEGHVYDDTEGESEGWDHKTDGKVSCDGCGVETDVNELMKLAGEKGENPENLLGDELPGAGADAVAPAAPVGAAE